MATNLKTSQAAADAQAAALTTACSNGSISIYGGSQPATPETGAGSSPLATFTLASTAFTHALGVMSLPATLTTVNSASGTATWFRVTSSAAAAQWDGSIGVTVSAAWTASHAYTVNTVISNGGNAYQCTTAGTSASSGGPTGTGSGITDGTAVWSYLGPASGDLNLNSIALSAAASLSVSSYTYTIPSA